MLNKSGLEPLGRAVLVRMIEVELAKNSPIVIPEHVRAQSAAMEQRAEVIAVGSECWRDEAQPRAKPGVSDGGSDASSNVLARACTIA